LRGDQGNASRGSYWLKAFLSVITLIAVASMCLSSKVFGDE
jgi:hypothetical protein